MKAITLWNPWAALCAQGAKRIETRSWRTDYRGPLAIHSSKKLTGEMLYFARQEPFKSALQGIDISQRLGVILAVVDLVDCRPMTERWISAIGEPERSFGLYEPGRFGWLFGKEVRMLKEPIPCRGAQGLWTVPLYEAALIGSQLA